MPTGGCGSRYCIRRTKEGKALDEAYARHEIGWAYYNKIRNKRKYWEYVIIK